MTSTSFRPRRKPDPQSYYKPKPPRDAVIQPAKALGQHFLVDQSIVRLILEAADLTPDSTVIEVGPGLGVLTGGLAQVASRVIAVEVDSRLVLRLKGTVANDHPNLVIVQHDILTVSPEELLRSGAGELPPYVVVANLPYNIGAAVLRHFLEAAHPPTHLVVMLQREVADSVCAQPGDLGLLGVSVQVYAEARGLFSVPAKAFEPPPKVKSSVIRLDLRDQPLVSAAKRERFFAIVRAGFNAPRKQLPNTLAQGLQRHVAEMREIVVTAGIDPTLRPQSLSIDDWKRLTAALADSL